MTRRVLILFALALAVAAAQSNPSCPNATGTSPHCTVLSWSAPASGAAPASYNVYRANATGQCTTVNTATCTRVGSVQAPVLTFTDNSSATNVLNEGATYFYVVTSAAPSGESAPSVEVSAKIPVLLPGIPTNPSSVAH